MQLIFANPSGWWALLMLPALVLIHSLHINRQPRIITTLFLVRSQTSERRGGRTFVFWKHSITFWLQVLAALLLTWLLLQPRWIGSQTTQRIAFVLDSSLSMDAYREATLNALRKESRSLADGAAHTHWLLTESRPHPQVLYSGNSRDEMLRAATQWTPSLGTHDWSAGLRAAHALAGSEAIVVFVTDHPPAQPPQRAHVLGVGTPLPNVGFTGLHIDKRAEETVWRTLVKNYSDQPAERQWWIEIDGQRLPARSIQLPADGSLALSGPIPAGVTAMTLVLEDDALAVDNRLPLVLPRPKQLGFHVDAGEQTTPLAALLHSLPDTLPVPESTQADLLVTQFEPALPALPSNPAGATETADTAANPLQADGTRPTSAQATADRQTETTPEIRFARPTETHALPRGSVSAIAHPLNEGLNWNALALHGDVSAHTPQRGETPLVWLGSTPLIWLEEQGTSRALVFNLSPRSSNILKLPAAVLLISRFAEDVRSGKAGYEAVNTELGQGLRIRLPHDTRQLRLNTDIIPAATNPLILSAPARPAHFTLSAEGTPLLDAAAYFADVREADLRHAASASDLAELRAELIQTNSEADSLHAWWLLLLAAVLLASWYYAERGR